jgi:hypothetical protein
MTLVVVCGAGAASAQFGQAPLPPAGSIGGAAVAGFQRLNENGPGWLYYGVNAADRGLGYNGSYMTLGGFVPYGEDDLGGLWAADLRSHLSVNGGFFSNVGAVRKQFIGGTLLGVGVYWDFDGDMNQYPTGGALGTEQFGQFGHAYNQVGVSGEWLTDYGNLRSNGYIPVGTTAHTVGAPGYAFHGNNLLCQYGLDAALGGADLEVGAYIPGLADWAGMVSVGGYALGNTRYDWTQGTQAGQSVVPWFGGVYTRLDMTFLRNWDFSLQGNNDSFFDWTGFARLTYRMGGSRRRNVPDQVEQPMMRNEHIVRAHQTPIVAINPDTGTAWNVIHVDNTAAFGGNGSAETPVQTLAAAQGLATNPYDVVFVHTGTSSAAAPYASDWVFQADNQILVGAGSTLELATANCGFEQFFNTGRSGSNPTTAYPVLSSSGTAIMLRDGAIVDHLRIVDAPVGIAADASLTAGANVNDVAMVGTNAPGQVGIQIVNVPSGDVNFFNMRVTDMGSGLVVDGGAPAVAFQGTIAQRGSAAPSVRVQNMTGGSVDVNTDAATLDTLAARNPRVQPIAYSVTDTDSAAPAAIDISNNIGTPATPVAVSIGRTTIATPTQQGVAVQGNTSTDVLFSDLTVTDATAEAFVTQSNDVNSSVSIVGRSSLSSMSAAVPAFASNDAAQLLIELESLSSQTVAPLPAVELLGTSIGSFTISDAFTVQVTNLSPPPATLPGPGSDPANVTNLTPVTVTLPPP